ncbi:hypothetical protein HGRIS_011120 [Hohenbuehelia grisea]|uniref:Extracellular membrane protein CFEM domain-containing protein n=1 Tax=Hohenbuehelia grisea TaxID=104357 RepID=A0ABR3IYW2_9AGAR
MTRFTGFLAGCALLVAPVAAVKLHPRGVNDLHQLLARQTTLDPGSLPTQCQTACNSIVSTLNNVSCASDLSCLCTNANGRGLENCVNCLVSLNPSSAALRAQGQSILTNFESGCSNFNLSPLTVSGGSSIASGSATGAPISRASGSSTPTSFSTFEPESFTFTPPRSTATSPRPTITVGGGPANDDSPSGGSSGDSGSSSGSDNPFGLGNAAVAVSSGMAGAAALVLSAVLGAIMTLA